MDLSNTEASIVTSFGLLRRVVETLKVHCAKPKPSSVDRRFEGILFAGHYVGATDGASAAVWFPKSTAVDSDAWSHQGERVLFDQAQLTDALNHFAKLASASVRAQSSRRSRATQQHYIDSMQVTLATNGPTFMITSDDLVTSGRMIRNAGFPFEALETYFDAPANTEPLSEPVYWLPFMLSRVGESFERYAERAPITLNYLHPREAARFEFTDRAGKLLVLAMPARGK